MRVRRGATLALVLVVLGLCSACASSSLRPSTTTATTTSAPSPTPHRANVPYGPGGTWRLVFSDRFTGSTFDTADWSTCYHFGCTDEGNDELEWYRASQVTVDNGTVSLTVVPEQTNGKKYVSGMLSSYGKFSFLYGYAQIVAKLPVGRGLWSSFWTEPESGGWPPEIDILENWAQSDSVNLFVHFGAANHFVHSAVYLPTASSAFHTYGVDWEPGSISWYVDGFLWAHFAVSITQPEYLIADLAVDGKLPPNSAVPFPQSLVIRSIEVWQHPSRIGARTTH
jgi:beta-glucanase (GH16 family)